MARKSTINVNEAVIEHAVCGYATNNGWLVRKLRWIGRSGAPDRFFAKSGRMIFIEFKRTDGDARLQQEREHKRLRKAGMEVYVVNDIEAGCALFD